MSEIVVPDSVKGLIFDCDGTLADTHFLHQEAWDETLLAYGETSPPLFLDDYKGVPTRRIVEIYNEKFGKALDVASVTEDKERRVTGLLASARIIEPVVAVARSHKGILPMAVASGGVGANVLVTLAAIGLTGFFDAVLSADDVARGKPFPDIFLEAARRLGVAPTDCMVFEDSDLGVEAAHRAGMIAYKVCEMA